MTAWRYAIDLKWVFNNQNLTFAERRDAIARTLRSHRWLRGRTEFDELNDVVYNLGTAGNEDEFNQWMDELYDHADADNVWIETRGAAAHST